MQINFSIHYHTRWGERLFVAGSHPKLGGWNPDRAIPMEYTTGGTWRLNIQLSDILETGLSYKYFLFNENSGFRQWEWGGNRTVELPAGRTDTLNLNDTWLAPNDPDNILCTSPFRNVLIGPYENNAVLITSPILEAGVPVFRFQVSAPAAGPDQDICVIGGHPALGAWDQSGVVVMGQTGTDLRCVDIAMPAADWLIEYKYAIYDRTERRVVEWEHGANRRIAFEGDAGMRMLTVRSDGRFRRAGARLWRGAGVSVPVFSLRSKDGLGVGEFRDIRLLVDWAVEAGMKMIQLLPVNDTIATHTWVDSYPYAAISVFALHPIYMNLEEMGIPERKVSLREIRRRKTALNKRVDVDYEAAMKIKSRYFKQAYDAVRDDFSADPEYKSFFEKNKGWLVPYAVFSCLRDRYKTSNYQLWPEYSSVMPGDIEKLSSPDSDGYDDIAVHYFIQYHLHKQLLKSADYARARGVIVKGDVPIGVYRHSVDTWRYPEFFDMGVQVGAPPDDFSAAGQNWGFPAYRWNVMARDGFAWWRARLEKMAIYFDAFRIDHVLGFFRVWEIPVDQVDGLLGRFNPALPLTPGEIWDAGLDFNADQYCEPYITEEIVKETFGSLAKKVKSLFFDDAGDGKYRLKEGLRTQREVAGHLERLKMSKGDAERIRAGLFELIADVVFLKDDDGLLFPRSVVQRTLAFRALNQAARGIVEKLYNDFFYARHNELWRRTAMSRLPAIRGITDMLICGEDLGMVPDCVAGVLNELEILSLCIGRMSKTAAEEFHDPAKSPYLAVNSTSTHDMSTLREWWMEDRERTQRFFNNMLGCDGVAPADCGPDMCRMIIERHLQSPAMWAVFPLQDVLGMSGKLRRKDPAAERINDPAVPVYYWRYRMHIDLEDLVRGAAFTSQIREMLEMAGRCSGKSCGKGR